MRRFWFFVFALSVLPPLFAGSYRIQNPELGIVYRPIDWDKLQWDAVFRDPSPPMGWAIIPIGKESCGALTASWLSSARAKKFRIGLLLDPFLSKDEILRTVDCAASLGVQRIVLDEYVSYHTQTLKEQVCAVLGDVRAMYDYSKKRHPEIEFGVNDNWQTWVGVMSRGAKVRCGTYPYFKTDLSGVSVLSKYGNPIQGQCGHPTANEMRDQLIDLKPIVTDYSITGRIFAWQINGRWYPGGANALELFRQMLPIYGWDRFILFGPTADDIQGANWGYKSRANVSGCPKTGYQWYLPARDYLIRIIEGAKTAVNFQAPLSARVGQNVNLRGSIQTADQKKAVPNGAIQLNLIPPPGTVRKFVKTVVAPPGAHFAFVGIRINNEIPLDVKGTTQFSLNRAQLFEAGSSKNLVSNGDFDHGFAGWIVFSTTTVSVVSHGSEKSLEANCSTNQLVTVTSLPMFVHPGRTYKIEFDAGIFQEGRNNGYFYISWTGIKSEIRRDRLYMTFPNPKTHARTVSASNGTFNFNWRPQEPGRWTLSAFYRGTSAYQPAVASVPVVVN